MAQDQDPWAAPGKGSRPSDNKPANGSNDEPTGRNQEQSPPDLEEAFANLLKKLGGGKKGSAPQQLNPKNYAKLLPIAAAVGLVIWGLSGFYTVKEAERGVVTRFGQLHSIVQPGLNWKPTFIDQVIPVNVERVRELKTQGSMLTQDENMVKVELTVQYRVVDPAKYKFSVTDADDSLGQATDSALRYVVGHMTMDNILTTGRAVVRENTWKALNSIIKPYDMGLEVIDVNFQSARPPEEVKDAFDDAIKAQEDEQRYIREAEAYAREREPIARGNAQKIIEEATAYKDQIVLDAQGEVERFQRLLPEFKASPAITKERLYIQTMENLMAKTPKVMMDGGNNLAVLPMDQLLRNKQAAQPAQPFQNEQPSNQPTSQSAVNSQSILKQPAPVEPTQRERQGRFN
ncbi:FtsH protease activity modulator HflK [Exercitatus varius]|uniref:Protein HflK n=1 Tax=Exercitatus varius TaxID=67857 RepID=A0AAW6QB41_9PAST|nr:FtsH protease activity modulator HflK [Exercitatus varius]MDG2942692.1 FtsH protease activity modulator HflK [Exercitatus varius]MDG2949348.1 FtsH protease activity modulator HflK [Exercitatus varius]MDG2951920.1 FtsH protease activity modulator HflK [Exercitatus varius]